MKPTSALKRALVAVRSAWRAGRHARALAEVDRLLQLYCDNPHLLVLRGQLIQLQDDGGTPTLEDAKVAFQRAAALDEQSPAALIELGHYVFAVEDDAEAASKHFHKAITLCKALLKEALLGQASALSELGRRHESLACVAEAYWLESHNGKSPAKASEEEVLDRMESLRRAE